MALPILTMALVAGASAQNAGRVVALPAPALPPNADLSTLAQNQQVFVDLWKKQIVVLMPDNTAPGGVRQQRFDMTDQTDSTVSSAVSTDSPGFWRYTYSVQPGPRAKGADRLIIDVPETAAPQNAGLIPFATDATTIPIRHAPEHGNLVAISWKTPPAAARLDTLTLSMTSNYLPGITEAYLQSKAANPLTPEIVKSLSPQVAQQLQRSLQPEWTSIRNLVIAPTFPPDVAQRAIAANYHVSIQMLVHQHALSSGSPLVNTLLTSLGTYLANDTDAAFPALPSVTSGTPLEEAILQAIHIAFRQ